MLFIGLKGEYFNKGRFNGLPITFTGVTMSNYIIDTNTKGHKRIVRRLSLLKSTLAIQDNGQYNNCPECSQISVESTLTEDELDNWLWKNSLDYIGVVEDDN